MDTIYCIEHKQLEDIDKIVFFTNDIFILTKSCVFNLIGLGLELKRKGYRSYEI